MTKGNAPVKVCVKCFVYNPSRVLKCQRCGHEFELGPNARKKADDAAKRQLNEGEPDSGVDRQA
jgi:ribosomal protein L40E